MEYIKWLSSQDASAYKLKEVSKNAELLLKLFMLSNQITFAIDVYVTLKSFQSLIFNLHFWTLYRHAVVCDQKKLINLH